MSNMTIAIPGRKHSFTVVIKGTRYRAPKGTKLVGGKGYHVARVTKGSVHLRIGTRSVRLFRAMLPARKSRKVVSITSVRKQGAGKVSQRTVRKAA